MSKLASFIREHKITEVECLIPDMAGIARGKILPAEKLLRILRDRGLRIPESIFVQTVTGDYPEDEEVTSDTNGDVYMIPSESTVRFVPWYPEPTAQVICDATYEDGKPVPFSCRHILRRVVDLYAAQGWQPLVAPELEFFLVDINKDPDDPLVPPIGRSGRQESGRQAYGVDAVNEFDPIFEDVYDYCEAQEIDVDTLTHEAGAAQIEINFNHGEPIDVADQTFMFKRTTREAAIRHKVFATFMAKPMANEPGSALHIHQSCIDLKTKRNVFATKDGRDSKLFLSHIAGLQKYLPHVMPLLAPNVNSYRRLIMGQDSPINTQWGHDNRTAGLRVPVSGAQDRRVENRVPGADANPYLAIAASLACGYLGMMQELEPTDPITGSAQRKGFGLPRHMFDGLQRFNSSRAIREVFGDAFVDAVVAVKETEYDAYQRVISSWERQNLLLNV